MGMIPGRRLREAMLFVAERRLNLARPLKAGIGQVFLDLRRVSDD